MNVTPKHPSRDSHGADFGVSPKPGERGYALLIVFLMAAAIALMLYQQMPRVAFESERDKEQLLVDRGEQYKRAIQLYVITNKRYPARIEDLENTNDKRFLRKRYIDPFTGKNEWRLVHTNGMFLTDSLVQKPPAAPGDDKSKDTTATNATGATGTTTPPDVNATVFQRPSDRTLPNGVPGQFPGQFPGQMTDPNQVVGIGPGQTAFPPITLSQIQGTVQPGTLPPNGQGTLPPNGQGMLPPGVVQNGVPGTIPPGLPGGVPFQFPNPTGNGQLPGQGTTDPSQLQPGQSPFGQTGPGGVQGAPGAAGQTDAAKLIMGILSRPTNPPPGIGVPASNNTLGGGIAGVASTFEGPSIKSYNTRTKFNEWEFVFQNQQQTAPGQGTPQPNGQPGQQTGTGTTPVNGPPAQ